MKKTVARVLDSLGNGTKTGRLLDYLDSVPLGSLRRDLDLVAPEELASIFNLAVSLANVQTSNLERRMGDIQAGSAGFSASGYASNVGGPSYSGGGSYGPAGKGGKELRAPDDQRLGVFVTGVGEFTNIGNTSNARGYDLTTGGFTLSVDYKLTPNWAIGINTGYARLTF